MGLQERLPSPFPRTESSDFQTWLEAHQSELDALANDIEQVQTSLRLAEATGQSLDLIGREYGRLGRRRGRSDDAYRAFLLSLVQAFGGRGTVPGLRLAIAIGVRASIDDVSLIEDFQTQEYEVVLENEAWAAHASGTVRELADLADPSVVQLREPVQNQLVEAALGLATGDTAAATINSADTFGTGRFDGEDTFS